MGARKYVGMNKRATKKGEKTGAVREWGARGRRNIQYPIPSTRVVTVTTNQRFINKKKNNEKKNSLICLGRYG